MKPRKLDCSAPSAAAVGCTDVLALPSMSPSPMLILINTQRRRRGKGGNRAAGVRGGRNGGKIGSLLVAPGAERRRLRLERRRWGRYEESLEAVPAWLRAVGAQGQH